LAAAILLSASPEKWDALIARLSKFSPSLNHRIAGEKVHKLAGVLAAEDPLAMNEFLVTGRWPPTPGTPTIFPSYNCLNDLEVPEQIMFLDMMTYLPDDIMVKVDRASMAVSLETRAPFLDHEIVEFAWSLQKEQKIRGAVGKWLLRQVLYRYVPEKLIDRPKMGFGIPVGLWLRKPLREWAESLLTPEKLNRQSSVDPSLISHRWHQHLSGGRNWTEAMWSVLVYQAWLDSAGLRNT
jgi:asparagine synthase (glutamine-hydrolysing)